MMAKMSSLKVAVRELLRATLLADAAGVVLLMVGAVVSSALPTDVFLLHAVMLRMTKRRSVIRLSGKTKGVVVIYSESLRPL